MALKGVLFDLDGVLIDSEGIYTRFWEETEKIYPTGIDDFAHFIKGSNLASILGYFPTEEMRRAVEQRIHDFDRDLVFPLFDGAEALLQQLADAQIPAALVTSSDAPKMQRLYALYPHFSSYFATIVHGDMVTHSKPHPEGYLTAAKLLGVNPAECVVVEDSRQGLQAGRAAGAKVVGLYTTLPESEVAPLADLTLPEISRLSLKELLQLAI